MRRAREVRIEDSLFVGNKTGIWGGGNKKIEIVGNAFVNHGGSGILVEATSGLLIKNNVFFENTYFGIHAVEMASMRIFGNIFSGNGCGLGLNASKGSGKSLDNTSWEDASEDEQRRVMSVYRGATFASKSAIVEDPLFKDSDHGDFSVGAEAVKSAGHGLSNPAAIQTLWIKYQEFGK